MASELFIMPGLKIPDNNFNWPIGDTWSATGIGSGDYYIVAPRTQGCYDSAYTYGTGRSVSFGLSGLPGSGTYTEYIESSYTPYEVAAGPASSLQLRLWVGVIASTAGVSSVTSSSGILRVSVIGYDADGTEREEKTIELLTKRSENSFTLYQGVIEETSFTTSVRWYKVRIAICQHSTNDSGRVILDWIGVGLCSEATGDGPQLSSWYGAQGSHSSETDKRWVSGRFAEQPLIHIGGRAAHMQTISLQFPYIQTVDKRLMQACWLWNSGAPTDDYAGAIAYVDSINRGTSQPVIIAPDRANMKRAMYCDMSGAPWQQATQGMWPDSSEIWSSSVTFRERP